MCINKLSLSIFLLELSASDARTQQAPVVFRGQSNSRTVFYGGMEPGRFEVVNPELWRVYIPEVARFGLYFEQLYLNGERRFRAQTPNHGEFFRVKRMEETVIDSQGGQIPAFTSKKMSLHAIWFRQNCSNSTIEHCHLYDLEGGGVKIGSTSWQGNDVADLSRLTHHIKKPEFMEAPIG